MQLKIEYDEALLRKAAQLREEAAAAERAALRLTLDSEAVQSPMGDPSAESLDADGVAWDTALHSDPPRKTAKGKWRKKRGGAGERPPSPKDRLAVAIADAAGRMDASDLDALLARTITGANDAVGGFALLSDALSDDQIEAVIRALSPE